MSWVAGAIGGAALVGAIVNSNAANNAASAQRDAANSANATSMAQYNQTRQDQMPWLNAGKDALGQIQSQMPDLSRSFSMADFQNDPGYAFRMQEGQKAIERSAAARGGGNSGATMKALNAYNSGQASQEYQGAYDRFNNDRTQRFNKLASLAGLGQTAAGVDASAGASSAANISSNTLSAGNASAASSIAQGNAINSAIGNGMNTWMNYQYMNKQPALPELTDYYQK
jgi:hypothetical protein